MDVPRPPRIHGWNDGAELEAAVCAGLHHTVELEIPVALVRAVCARVHVNALVIGLPDFDAHTGERLAGGVNHAAAEHQHIPPRRRPAADARKVAIGLCRHGDRIIWPFGLCRGRLKLRCSKPWTEAKH